MIINRSKRVKGDSTYIATIIGIMFILLVFIISINLFCNLVKTNDVDRVSRKYILRMERVGYLTDEDKTSLVAELTNLGVVNIDTSGSSTTPVGYGNTVVLVLKCNIPIYEIEEDANGNFKSVPGIYSTYNRTTTGTAMY